MTCMICGSHDDVMVFCDLETEVTICYGPGDTEVCGETTIDVHVCAECVKKALKQLSNSDSG